MIVKKALAHYYAAGNDPTLPDIGSRWGPQFEKMRAAIGGLRDPAEVIRYAQEAVTFEARAPGAPLRTLEDWNPLVPLDLNGYIEGLDRLRQSLTVENAEKFLTITTAVPWKERVWIAKWLKRPIGDGVEDIIKGGYVYA